MNKKTNLFVCILIALSINLQSNLLAFAQEVNDTTVEEEQALNTEPIEVQVEKVNDTELINGVEELSSDAFTRDDKTQENF